jgi:hypothetical protein
MRRAFSNNHPTDRGSYRRVKAWGSPLNVSCREQTERETIYFLMVLPETIPTSKTQWPFLNTDSTNEDVVAQDAESRTRRYVATATKSNTAGAVFPSFCTK